MGRAPVAAAPLVRLIPDAVHGASVADSGAARPGLGARRNGCIPRGTRERFRRWLLDSGGTRGVPVQLAKRLDLVYWTTLCYATMAVVGLAIAIRTGSSSFVAPSVALMCLPALYRLLNRRGYTTLSRVAYMAVAVGVVSANTIRAGPDAKLQFMLIPLAVVCLVAFDAPWRTVTGACIFGAYTLADTVEWEATDPDWESISMAAVVMQRVVGFLMIYLSVGVAVSERQALIASNEVAQREVAHAEGDSAAKMRFMTVMSHEIRTPLHAILGLSDILSASLAKRKAAEDVDLARTIQGSSKALLATINAVLDFARSEADQMTLTPGDVDIGGLVEDVCVSLAPIARDGVELVCDVQTALGLTVRADAARLRQVLNNIVGNALKFTETGFVRVGVSSSQQWLDLVVEDSGPGIPADALPTVFEAFTQAEQTTTRRFDGTGLGLAISKRIVVAMGGEVSVQSAGFGGTTFSVRVPLELGGAPPKATAAEPRNVLVLPADDEKLRCSAEALGRAVTSLGHRLSDSQNPDTVLVCAESAESAESTEAVQARYPDARVLLVAPLGAAAAGGVSLPLRRRQLASALNPQLDTPPPPSHHGPTERPLAGLRILVAEDNHVNQRLVRMQLLKLGCEAEAVEVVDNGAKCVAAFRRQRPDVVLMDCHMPVMDGLEATRAIRVLDQETPVLALTADGFDEARQSALRAGMTGVLVKPVAAVDLCAAILEAAGRSNG